MNDPVREFLQAKGCSEHVIQGGLVGLIESWEHIVENVIGGYDLGLDDYLNDMDARQLLAEAFTIATSSQRQQYQPRVEAADQQLRSLLVPTAECIWGDEVAAGEGWTRKGNWWYFHYPKNAGADLLSEVGENWTE